MKRQFQLLSVALFLGTILVVGCGGDLADNQNNNQTNDNSDSGTVPEGFENAQAVSFEDNLIIVEGEIASDSDVDVYDLGALSLGDGLAIDCQKQDGSDLDPMIALFDGDGYRAYWNDDINPGASDFDAAIDGVVRHDSGHYYLAVTRSDLADPTTSIGPYRVSVQLQPGAGLDAIRGHTVRLHFAAAQNVTISGDAFGDQAELDAAILGGADFEGRTEELEAILLQIVSDDYAPFDVAITSTDEGEPAEDFTTVFFGDVENQNLFGLADDVDFYNASTTDNAIIFLRSFTGLSDDLSLVAQAVANVASHEIGHTLGLMHTTDVTELMDTTGDDFTLLDDQDFGVADVFDFPIGQQDAVLLLGETVGERSGSAVRNWPADGRYRCGTCGATMSLFNKNTEK